MTHNASKLNANAGVSVASVVKGFFSLFHRSKRYDLTGLSDYQLQNLGLRRDQISALNFNRAINQNAAKNTAIPAGKESQLAAKITDHINLGEEQ